MKSEMQINLICRGFRQERRRHCRVTLGKLPALFDTERFREVCHDRTVAGAARVVVQLLQQVFRRLSRDARHMRGS